MLADRFNQEIDRVKGGVSAAAKHLGKSRNTIYNWMQKGNIPLNQLEKLESIGVDVRFVSTGRRDLADDRKTADYGANTCPNARSNADRVAEENEPYGDDDLDAALRSVIDDYVTREIVSEIDALIDSSLHHQGIVLDDAVRAKLRRAALDGHTRLSDSGHIDRFDKLLQALIDLVLKENGA